MDPAVSSFLTSSATEGASAENPTLAVSAASFSAPFSGGPSTPSSFSASRASHPQVNDPPPHSAFSSAPHASTQPFFTSASSSSVLGYPGVQLGQHQQPTPQFTDAALLQHLALAAGNGNNLEGAPRGMQTKQPFFSTHPSGRADAEIQNSESLQALLLGLNPQLAASVGLSPSAHNAQLSMLMRESHRAQNQSQQQQSSVPSGAASTGSRSGSSGEQPKVVPDIAWYKTRICRNWAQTGSCPFGKSCLFAHGEHQLRKVNSQNVIERISGAPGGVGGFVRNDSSHSGGSDPGKEFDVQALARLNALTQPATPTLPLMGTSPPTMSVPGPSRVPHPQLTNGSTNHKPLNPNPTTAAHAALTAFLSGGMTPGERSAHPTPVSPLESQASSSSNPNMANTNAGDYIQNLDDRVARLELEMAQIKQCIVQLMPTS